jgi:hypothetical protein
MLLILLPPRSDLKEIIQEASYDIFQAAFAQCHLVMLSITFSEHLNGVTYTKAIAVLTEDHFESVRWDSFQLAWSTYDLADWF